MVKKVSSMLNQKNSFRSASIILIVTLFLSNVLGVIRDHYLTQKIPTDTLSVYYAAFRIPDFIFNILILGAIASAFIPVFTTLITQKKQEEAWNVASSILNIAIVVLIFFSLILFFIMPFIVPYIVPGFDSEKQFLTIKLARIMLLSPILFGISYIFGGILNSFKRFFIYSLAPLVYNLSIILGTILLADKYSVVGVAYSVIFGAFLHFLIQFPVVIKLGFRWHLKIIWSHWGVRRIGLLMFPRSIALGANQIMLLIFTAMASAIGGYAVAVYNLADNIQTMPMVVFGTSFATAIFPTLSEKVSLNKMSDFAFQIIKTMKVIIFFLVPITAILILLRTETVRLILGSGYFGWEQTILTANTLGIFSLALVFSGLIPLFSRSFYALHNTKIPMVITVLSVVLSILLAKIFSVMYGVLGLALGFSIGTFFNALVLFIILRKKVSFEKSNGLFKYTLKIIIATILMSIAIQESKMLIGLFVDMQKFWGVATKLISSASIGVGIYLLCCWIFGCEEIKAISIILNRFNRKNYENVTNQSD